ncbi:DNA polymerase III subunit delta [Mesobaculum littorinae]|uniref:DNA-directed DNA polymerase n=1 Tax=Mesobaculum littorinae TaxID=2486419 RepID=A0A438AD76_9RHOB|nr:DNA polymerase III subunit delta [Mesobaculum littorinae]RVV96663.1 DNA polymerase III subunit delta [Mesobaculum littorinae]
MKLSSRDGAAFIRRPPSGAAGALLYGGDAMRVAMKRAELVGTIVGPEGEAEMRLTRITAADLRRDPTLAVDALREQGFFPGPRVVLIEEAGDGLTDPIKSALADWREGDAQLVVTAGVLPARSKLRKLFESHRSAAAIGIYDDPPGRDEIEAMLSKAGLRDVGRDAMGDLESLARAVGPGDLAQTIEKLGLYKHGDTSPLSSEDVTACAPASTEAALDDLLNAAAEARTADIGRLMSRIEAQGTSPTSLCIGAVRHFRQLYAAASDPGGPGSGIAKLRPPVFGPRRDRMLRQAQGWGAIKLEQALSLLVDCDLTLRSAARAPQMAVMERALIRLSMMAR